MIYLVFYILVVLKAKSLNLETVKTSVPQVFTVSWYLKFIDECLGLFNIGSKVSKYTQNTRMQIAIGIIIAIKLVELLDSDSWIIFVLEADNGNPEDGSTTWWWNQWSTTRQTRPGRRWQAGTCKLRPGTKVISRMSHILMKGFVSKRFKNLRPKHVFKKALLFPRQRGSKRKFRSARKFKTVARGFGTKSYNIRNSSNTKCCYHSK